MQTNGKTPKEIREALMNSIFVLTDACDLLRHNELRIEKQNALLALMGVGESEECDRITPNEYQRLAMRTCNIPYEDKQGMLIHATTGLASEAGEFAGLLQKTYQGHEYDRAHALKELGDCCWMIAEACTALNATLEEVMQLNIDKLKARYPEGFDAEKSLHRKEGDV